VPICASRGCGRMAWPMMALFLAVPTSTAGMGVNGHMVVEGDQVAVMTPPFFEIQPASPSQRHYFRSPSAGG